MPFYDYTTMNANHERFMHKTEIQNTSRVNFYSDVSRYVPLICMHIMLYQIRLHLLTQIISSSRFMNSNVAFFEWSIFQKCYRAKLHVVFALLALIYNPSTRKRKSISRYTYPPRLSIEVKDLARNIQKGIQSRDKTVLQLME